MYIYKLNRIYRRLTLPKSACVLFLCLISFVLGLMWQGVKSFFSNCNVFMVNQPTSHATICVVNLNCRLAYAVWLLHELYEKFPEGVNHV